MQIECILFWQILIYLCLHDRLAVNGQRYSDTAVRYTCIIIKERLKKKQFLSESLKVARNHANLFTFVSEIPVSVREFHQKIFNPNPRALIFAIFFSEADECRSKLAHVQVCQLNR